MASNNSKFNTEMKMAGTSFCIAILVFLVLKFLTSETRRMQNNRHKKEKRKKCAEIQAEQRQALKNIEMNQARTSPFLERRSKSDSSLLRFCHQSQSFTLASPKNSVCGTPSAKTPSAKNNENVFNFDSKHISRVLSTASTRVSTPVTEVYTMPRSPGFTQRRQTVGEIDFGFADNYREWSLRRRDLEISAMNFNL